MESITSIFHIDWKILIAQTINFTAMALVLWYFIWKPLSNTLEERGKKIDVGLKMAEENQTRLETTKLETEKLIREAKTESQKILERASEEAKLLRNEEIEASKQESLKIIEAGKHSLLLEKENILKSIRAEASELVTLAAKSVLKGVASPEIDINLAQKALAELTEENK